MNLTVKSIIFPSAPFILPFTGSLHSARDIRALVSSGEFLAE